MIKPAGKTTAVSVTASSSTAVTVGAAGVQDYVSKCAFLNTGATVVAVKMGAVAACPAAVLPIAGTASDSNIVLPAAMTAPVVFSTPACPFDITLIATGAGPSIVYITPCEE